MTIYSTNNSETAYGNTPTLDSLHAYRGFGMKSANVEPPAYAYKHEIPEYRTLPPSIYKPPQVALPKNTVNGRKIKPNYSSFNAPDYPDFYPIYGPQGYKPIRSPRKTNDERPKYWGTPEEENAPRERPENRGKQLKEIPENRKEPRNVYSNEPDTTDR